MCNDVMIPKLDYRIWIIFCWYIVLKCFLNDLVPGTFAQHTLTKSSSLLSSSSSTPDDIDIFSMLDDNVTNGHQSRRRSSKHLVSYAANLEKINSYVNDNKNERRNSDGVGVSVNKSKLKVWSGIVNHRNNNNYDYYHYKNDNNNKNNKNNIASKSKSFAKLANKNSNVEYIKISRLQKRSSERIRNFYHHRWIGVVPREERQPIEEVETQHEKPLHQIVRRSATDSIVKGGSGGGGGTVVHNPGQSSSQVSAAAAAAAIEKQQNYHQKQEEKQKQQQTLQTSSSSLATMTKKPMQNETLPTRSLRNNTTVANDDDLLLLDDEPAMVSSTVSPDRANKNPRHIDDDDDDVIEEPRALPLRPIIQGGPFEDDPSGEVQHVYAEQRAPIKLTCEVDLEIVSSSWMKDGQIVHVVDKSSRSADFRFYREPLGSLTITNVMLEDDGIWQCEAENFRGYIENARPIRLIVLDPPKPPYLLIDSRRLDAGNIFVPVKENSELSLACISEGGNPKPTLVWEVLLSPAIDRHAQKISTDGLELQDVKRDVDKDPFKITTGAISEARLPAVYRAHHNARILCVMEHPTLKVRQNASILLDVQYTPSFAITRSPGFGNIIREGIEVSLKCDVDSNPPSTPMWQKDDQEPPVPQNGDGFLNFTSIRREHSGWYKCTSRHLNTIYSSIGYFLSVRSDTVDVTSEPVEQEQSMPSSHNPYKTGQQMEVELGGSVTLQCPQGSLGCWSHFDPYSSKLRGLGQGIYAPVGHISLKDVVYTDGGNYKCIGQSVNNKKKLEVLQTVSVSVKGPPTVSSKNTNPIAHPGSPLHLNVEFCANPAAYAARWLHGDRIYHPGNQYGVDVLAYAYIDTPTLNCKEARLTYVHMHDKVPRQFFFIVSSTSGVAEITFNVNFTLNHKTRNQQTNRMPNTIDEDEALMAPEEIHFPIFGTSNSSPSFNPTTNRYYYQYITALLVLLTCFLYV